MDTKLGAVLSIVKVSSPFTALLERRLFAESTISVSASLRSSLKSPSPVIVFTVTSYSVPEMGLMLSITPAASPEVVVREKSSVATLNTASSKVTVKMTLAALVGLDSPASRTMDTKLGAVLSIVKVSSPFTVLFVSKLPMIS